MRGVRHFGQAGEWVAAATVPALFAVLPQHMEGFLPQLAHLLTMLSMTSCSLVCEESLCRFWACNVAWLRRYMVQKGFVDIVSEELLR